MRFWLNAGAILACLLLTGNLRAAEPARVGITVLAAASLTETLQELGADYQKRTGIPVRVSFGSSGTLARQIEAGIEADVFVSADEAWMDKLQDSHRLVPGTRRDLLTNRLVLIAAADNPLRLKLQPGAPLLAQLQGGRLAIADPDSVPAGRYAKAALLALGLWPDLEKRVVRAPDVRGALMWVANGESPLGIVYATDALAERKVRVVDVFPAGSHPRIAYPMAVLEGASRDAAGFEAFVASAAARAVFDRHGFGPP